jgi:hypothetical protein
MIIELKGLLDRVQRASERGQIDEAERFLKRALELDPESIQTLRQAAWFYHNIAPEPAAARHFAALCRAQAERIADEMGAILGQGSARGELPTTRYLGGIIGPY